MRTSNDPISDFLTRIMNASRVSHESFVFPYSNTIFAIAKILEKKGFVSSSQVIGGGIVRGIEVVLKYYKEDPVVRGVERVSKPGRRVYAKVSDIPHTIEGLGLTIVSTSKGILTRKECKDFGVGGEVLCKVW